MSKSDKARKASRSASRPKAEAQSGKDSGSSLSSTADNVVSTLHKTDGRLEKARRRLLDDPDTLADKALKAVIPSAIGLAGGKLFQSLWDKTANGGNSPKGTDQETAHKQGLLASLPFAVLSAAFGAVLSQLSTRGTQAFVTRRQSRRR